MVASDMQWAVGRHTLICGDSTARAVPADASVLIWDPPWECDLPKSHGRFRHVLAFTDARHVGRTISLFGVPTWVFAWDCVSSWWTPSSPLMRMKLCLWFGPLSEYQQDRYLLRKPQPARKARNNRGAYHYKGRPGTILSDVYCQPITEPRAHRHAKPDDWISAILGNCVGEPSVIYDPFAGSCTSVIAAERTGHTVIGVERDPATVDAALARLEEAGFEIASKAEQDVALNR